MKRSKILSLLFLFVFLIANIVQAAIVIDGKATKIKSIKKEGVTYVPLKDICKALGVKLSYDPKTRNINLSTGGALAGGAYQLKGVKGKIGEMLFNGVTRFKIIKVESASIDPQGEKVYEGMQWVLISVEIRNGLKTSQFYGANVHKMALVDDKDQLYSREWLKRDENWNKGVRGTELPPGGFLKGKYVFRIPSDANPVRIIFEPQIKKNEPVIRVNLTD